ncbi:MAG: T9SS type A sorting domain-containing protein [Bacteroidota bacterium]
MQHQVHILSTYGTYTTAVTKTVTVNAAPNVSVNSPTICATQSATLTATGASSYVWSTTATTASISVTPTSTTNYTVTGTDAAGCTAKKIATVVISTSNLNVNAATICAGGTVALVVSGANTYTWTSPASNSATVNVSPTVNTNYTVNGTNSFGCVHTATTSVSITSSPTIAINSATICSGATATLTATGVSSYTWTSPASNNAVISVTPNTTTTYSVSGTSAGCAGVYSATTMVTVNPTPTVSLAAITSTPCAGDAAVTLNGLPTGGTYTGTGVTGNSFNPSTAGTFTVVYSYTATNSCSSSDAKSITVNLCTGIEELKAAEVQIYPNPVKDILYINSNNTNLKTVEVYDLVGKKIISLTTAESLISINSNELTNGVYFVRIQSENAKPVIARFIKN